jgi:hypothetical protein
VTTIYLYFATISPISSIYCLLYLLALVSILLAGSSLSMAIAFQAHAHFSPAVPPIIYLVFVILSLPILARHTLISRSTILINNRSSTPSPRRLTGVGLTLADVPGIPAPRRFSTRPQRQGPHLALILSPICSLICLGFEAASRALSRTESTSSLVHSLDWLQYFWYLLWICFSTASLGCTCHHIILYCRDCLNEQKFF